jgi:hypothetical protein
MGLACAEGDRTTIRAASTGSSFSPLCRTLTVGLAGRYHLVKQGDGELRPKKDKCSNLYDLPAAWRLALGEGRRAIGLAPQNAAHVTKVYSGRKTMRRVV